MDQVTDGFDIVIKHQSEINDYIFESLVPRILNKNTDELQTIKYLQDSGWTVSYGYQLNETLKGDFYNYLREN